MPGVYDPYRDEENGQGSLANPLAEGQQNQAVSGSSAPKPMSGGQDAQLTAGSAQTTAPSANAQPKGPSSSGRFVNLQNYINANQNSGIGSAIANKVQDQASQSQVQLDTIKNNYQNQANANAVASQKYGAQVTGTGGLKDGLKDQSKEQQDAYFNFLAAGQQSAYSGPREVQGISSIQNNAKDLQAVGNAANTENGRFGLLQKYFKNPAYTGGQQKLDNMLLQTSPQEKADLSKISSIGGSLGSQISNTQKQASDFANLQDSKALNNRASASKAIDSGINQSNRYLNDLASAYLTRERANQSYYKQDLEGQLQSQGGLRAMGNLGSRAGLLVGDSAIDNLTLSDDQLIGLAGKYNSGLSPEELQSASADSIANRMDPNTVALLNRFNQAGGKAQISPGQKLQAGKAEFDQSRIQQAMPGLQNVLNQVHTDFSTRGSDNFNAAYNVSPQQRQEMYRNAVNQAINNYIYGAQGGNISLGGGRDGAV